MQRAEREHSMLYCRLSMAGLQHDSIPKAAADNGVRARDRSLSEELEIALFQQITEGWVCDQSRNQAIEALVAAVWTRLPRG